jgi:DNA repair exonuclease SbcCD ATPase subunit
MNKRTFLRHFAAGLMIGLMLSPQQAQAQWTVFDPTQYSLQVKKRIEEFNRWAVTIKQYQDMYTKAVENLTTVRGVLRTVDEQLFKNKQAALLANDIGKLISDSQKLRRRWEGMIRYQIRSLKSIDDRLSQGIFDPDADLRDLQNYLLYTMGRDARQTVDQMTNTARADAQLAAWLDEQKRLLKDVGVLSDELNKYLAQRDAVPSPPTLQEAVNIQHLNEMISALDSKIEGMKKRIKELEEKIQQRFKEHGLRRQDMENFAYEIDTTNEMWKELQKTKTDLQKTMDSLILGAASPAAE